MMTSLSDAASGLAALLEQENTALRLHDYAMTTALAELKRQAIARFTSAIAEQAEHPGPGLPAKSQGALRSRLDAALAENKRLLESSVKVQAEVIAIVLRSVEALPSPHYRANGVQSSGSAAPVALAVRA